MLKIVARRVYVPDIQRAGSYVDFATQDGTLYHLLSKPEGLDRALARD